MNIWSKELWPLPEPGMELIFLEHHVILFASQCPQSSSKLHTLVLTADRPSCGSPSWALIRCEIIMKIKTVALYLDDKQV